MTVLEHPMKTSDITTVLNELFPEDAVQVHGDVWQVEMPNFRLLVLVNDASVNDEPPWIRVMVPIASIEEAAPFAAQLLAANFDLTQETRYAFHEGALWGVYQHNLESLIADDLMAVIGQLILLFESGLSGYFTELTEDRLRQIIQASKIQGQTLETTMQTLERLYAEGMLGGLDQPAEEREKTLGAWRFQLERLWDDVEME